ncbi:hypothetical protein M514_22464 [Trichuris suis]|uniref:Uncharacterized protein n=1 Tax=Trichuris suis TaxID=68888 RepID=A0A085MQW5_9BILA|nr:hypothetical protein M513_08248 [Trichuris suis]KFD59611.1 hypothetical protein M514_08248 [Trichuris suis]KFD59614.1 hypothetical protein M514_28210 [Trichuris suis]KFD65304.1 hypothetical protein M514_22464 [Trichuris suis]
MAGINLNTLKRYGLKKDISSAILDQSGQTKLQSSSLFRQFVVIAAAAYRSEKISGTQICIALNFGAIAKLRHALGKIVGDAHTTENTLFGRIRRKSRATNVCFPSAQESGGILNVRNRLKLSTSARNRRCARMVILNISRNALKIGQSTLGNHGSACVQTSNSSFYRLAILGGNNQTL